MIAVLIAIVMAAAALPSEDVLLDKIAEVGRSMNLTEVKQDRAARLFVWRLPMHRVGPEGCVMYFAWSIQRVDDRSIVMYDPALSSSSCLHGVAEKDRPKAANKISSQVRETQQEFSKRFVKLVGPVEFGAVPEEMMMAVARQLGEIKAADEHK